MKHKSEEGMKVGIIIPAYKVKEKILDVITSIGKEVSEICVVDDGCPENSGRAIQQYINDPRVVVLFHNKNKGVGAAMKTGFNYYLDRDIDIIVKMDGDGQMKSRDLKSLIFPLVSREADYSKGNRFFSIESMRRIPKIRLFGNVILSFFSKAASGYWNIFDPNNGFVAIRKPVLREINFSKVSNRYFFESDMLFRLYLLGARVVDVPIVANYENEKSSLSLWKASVEFPLKHFRNLIKRIFLTYFVKDFSLPGLQLLFGSLFLFSGSVLGLLSFLRAQEQATSTPPGTLILFALLMFFGFQLILGFISYDVQNVPKRATSREIEFIQDRPTRDE